MSIKLDYKDTVSIYKINYNGYGRKFVDTSVDVPALFQQSTGTSHAAQVDSIDTSAHVYLDPENSFLISNNYRIEGMLLMASVLGGQSDETWYKISRVVVGQDKLLGNNVDNVHAYLTKASGVDNVS